MSSADAYSATATQLLARAREVNAPTLRRCGALIGANVAEGGVLHTFVVKSHDLDQWIETNSPRHAGCIPRQRPDT